MIMALGFFLSACKSTPDVEENLVSRNQPKDLIDGHIFASVTLEPKSGSRAEGKAWLTKSDAGFQLVVSVQNVKPGKHGIHFHEKGDCSAPDASSAGAHFNPTKLTHGTPDPMKHHVGDLGNITVESDGTGVLNLVIGREVFHPGFTDWTELIGKSLVLHEKVDDLKTQPSGDSGDRIACGVVVKE